jgi:hypothetical protein
MDAATAGAEYQCGDLGSYPKQVKVTDTGGDKTAIVGFASGVIRFNNFKEFVKVFVVF